MCFIIYLPSHIRLRESFIIQKAKANPHGIGIAFKARGKLWQWHKGLTADETISQLSSIPTQAEVVIHFRLATHGGRSPGECHPFPLDGQNTKQLSGKASLLLFHNGIADDGFLKALVFSKIEAGKRPPVNASDSELVAWLLARPGGPSEPALDYLLESIGGRWLVCGTEGVWLYGGWSHARFLRGKSPHSIAYASEKLWGLNELAVRYSVLRGVQTTMDEPEDENYPFVIPTWLTLVKDEPKPKPGPEETMELEFHLPPMGPSWSYRDREMKWKKRRDEE